MRLLFLASLIAICGATFAGESDGKKHTEKTAAEKAQCEAEAKAWKEKWAAMTPEEKAKCKAEGEAWKKKWDAMTPEEKAAHHAKKAKMAKAHDHKKK